MRLYVYPENYVKPEDLVKPVLSSQQRLAVKNRMKQYLNSDQSRKLAVKALVTTAQNYILENYGLHIHDSVLKEIALEIRQEYGVPDEPVE